MTYDEWKLASPPEYDAEDEELEDERLDNESQEDPELIDEDDLDKAQPIA